MNNNVLWAGGALAVAATAAFIAFMPDREEILTDLNLDPAENCASFGEEPEFGDSNRVRSSAEHIRQLLNQSNVGAFTDQYLVANDVAFCFGDPVSEFSSVAKHPRTEAYIIDDSLTDEDVALEILKSKTGKNLRGLVNNNSQLDPENAVMWSRMIRAHRSVAGLQQLLETADYDINSRFWNEVESDPQYGDIARIYSTRYAQSSDVSSALYTVFESRLRGELTDRSQTDSFLTWYEGELDDRLVPVVTPCFDADLNLSICTSLETAPPIEGTAAHGLSTENIVDMSSAFLTEDESSLAYISPTQAEELLADIDEWSAIPDSLISDYTSITRRAEEINGNYSGGGIGIGLTFGGRLAFTF